MLCLCSVKHEVWESVCIDARLVNLCIAEGEWPTADSGRFTPAGRDCTIYTGDWVSLRGMWMWYEGKHVQLAWNRNCGVSWNCLMVGFRLGLLWD